MINMPPRHGKSMTITESLPGYMAARYNRFKVIMTAYSSTLADDFARANTDKLERTPVFEAKVKTNNQERVALSNGSIIVKSGILGGNTGKGANLLIMDDVLKTEEEASSSTTKDKIWREWQSSLSTRLEPPAIVILIMTRWAEDDLAGRLLDQEFGNPLPWKKINLALEAEEDDILGREVGEPLWPQRYGYEFIEERKQDPKSFNALYQGRPTSQEGNMIKREWLKYYNRMAMKEMPYLCLSVDATFKDSKKSDFVSIQVWGKRNANYYLIDRYHARLDFVGTITQIKNMLYRYPKIRLKLIEDKANGSAIISVLNREIGGFVGVNPLGSKESRVQSILPYIEAGNVWLPQDDPSIREMVEELASFPNGKHDDDVDCMSQALYRLITVQAHLMTSIVDGDGDRNTFNAQVRDAYGIGKDATALLRW